MNVSVKMIALKPVLLRVFQCVCKHSRQKLHFNQITLYPQKMCFDSVVLMAKLIYS